MFRDPTINDFIGWQRFHLDKAAEEVRRAVRARQASLAARGLGQSGAMIEGVLDDIHTGFDRGVETALGELKRAVRTTKLDPADLRQMTAQLLGQYTIDVKAAIPKHVAEPPFPNLEPYVAKRIASLDELLTFKLHQFDVGFLVPEEPEVPAVTNNNSINVGSMVGAIQQGSPNAQQTVQASVDVQSVSRALDALEAALGPLLVNTKLKGEVDGDVQTIRAQIAKPTPSSPVLQEVGKSLRKLVESAADTMIKPGVAAAAAALWKSLGIF